MRGTRQAAARLLEAEVDRDRDAAHVADLEVEHHEVGVDVGERRAHVLAAGDLDHFLAGPDERRPHLVPNPLRVGRYENRGHRRESLRGGLRLRPNRGLEEDAADLVQRREVVHVACEVRDVRDRGRPHACLHTLHVRTLELGDLPEVGEVLVALRRAGGRRDRRSARASSAAAARRPAGASSPNCGCTRFTMSASIV